MRISLGFLCVIPSLLLAQVSNPFFPVQEGDYWEYFYYDQTRMDIAQVEMRVDSTDTLGNIYAYRYGYLLYSGDIYPGGRYRKDSLGNIYHATDNLILPYNVAELDWWIVYEYEWEYWDVGIVDTIYADTVLNIPTEKILIRYFGTDDTTNILGNGMPQNVLVFATTFGIVAGSEAFGGELGPGIELRGARIDSVEYGTLVGIAEEMPPVPDRIQLFPNFPNPFNNKTTIPFVLPTSALVRVTIYNMRGHEVKTLMPPTHLSAGRHTFTWDGTTQKGGVSSSGLYFYVVTVGNRNVSRSMLFVK